MIYYGNNDWRDYLAHYGVLGMKWGVRKGRSRDDRKQAKMAKKDAKKYAKAKMYYGEGAGIRRRHIQAIVNERSKNSVYKSEFESRLAKQDMEKAARSAKRERRARNAAAGTAKVARTAASIAGVTPLAAALYIGKKKGWDKKGAQAVKRAGSTLYSKARMAGASMKRQSVDDFIRRHAQ